MDTPSENFESQKNDFKFAFIYKRPIALGLMMLGGLVLLFPLILFIFGTFNTKNLEEAESPEVRLERMFSAPHVENELIIRLKKSYTLGELNVLKTKLDGAGVLDIRQAYESKRDYLQNYYIVTYKEGTDLKKVALELDGFDEIESYGPNYIFSVDEVPNDPSYPEMWGLSKIDMPNAWDVSKGSANVIAAVIDTGIDYNHQDFVGRNIIRGKDFATCNQFNSMGQCLAPKNPDDDPMDDQGHGTHVAGTIGAITNNSIGVSGVGWNVSLMAIKTMGSSGKSLTPEIVKGIEYAIDNNANVINMSLSTPAACDNVPGGYQPAIDEAVSRGIVVIVAAGNEGTDARSRAPANCRNVIVVGSTEQQDRRSSFSNHGNLVNLSAPGSGILSTMPNNSYAVKNGTSMATPHVVGVAALLLGLRPGLSVEQVKNCLINGADPITTDYPIGPRLNAFKTLNTCSGIAPITPIPSVPIVTSTPIITTTITQGVLTPSPTPIVVKAIINGSVFLDNNGNKFKDTADAGVANVRVALTGGKALEALTDSQGSFTFIDLSPGDYTVKLFINGLEIATSNLTLQQRDSATLRYALSPNYITPAPPGGAPAPVISVAPSYAPTPTFTPSPTPIKTYSCRERTDAKPALKGSIKIGNLVCEPNS